MKIYLLIAVIIVVFAAFWLNAEPAEPETFMPGSNIPLKDTLLIDPKVFDTTDGQAHREEYQPPNPAWRTGVKKHNPIPAEAIHFEARYR